MECYVSCWLDLDIIFPSMQTRLQSFVSNWVIPLYPSTNERSTGFLLYRGKVGVQEGSELLTKDILVRYPYDCDYGTDLAA